MERNFVGIDLHKEFFVAVAQDSQGNQLFKERYNCTEEAVTLLVSRFAHPQSVVVEAGGNWMWFVRLLEKQNCKVQLAHPFRVKAIASARIKTDSIDAKTLCDLLRADLIPQSYIAPDTILDNRELARARISLVHDQTMTKNRVSAIMRKDNLRFQGKDTFGVKGRKWLTEQEVSQTKREVIRWYLGRLDDLKGTIVLVDRAIKQRSSSFPEVKLLQTIPGIGITTAFLLVSEIGTVTRFPNAKKFTSYFGMVPRLSQSGNHAYYGRITKLGNPYIRWALVQTAHRMVRINKKHKGFVDKLAVKHGRKKALRSIPLLYLRNPNGYSRLL
ncbi:MAG TPA: IS110 family transposase [Methylomirabilota bacterium]|nr:IS110 family transposase [Methylomirabilota bacterium]